MPVLGSHSAEEIAERLCLRNDGKPLPSLEDFQKETEELRSLEKLADMDAK